MLGIAALLVGAAPQAARPNIVMILADDFGFECVGANGGESYRTPNLDRLAAGGVRFERCFVPPLCTPTRAELMTGRYNVRNYTRFGELAASESTFAHALKKAGYATAVCGKWQLGKDPGLPKRFGFDEALLWQHTRRPPRYANPGLERDGVEVDIPPGAYGPDLLNDFAVDFVARRRESPFFLYYPLTLTHDPFQPTPDSPDWDPALKGEAAKRDVRHFGEMVAYMDKLIGRLLAKLDELKLRENTLVIFMGDNGTHPSVTSRFRGVDVSGGKGKTIARGMHVPLIASWPAATREARVNGDLVGAVDVYATICEAAGAAPGETDGLSVLPQVRGEKGTPRDWLYSWYSPRQGADTSVRESAFDARWKLYRGGRAFDLAADPDELTPWGVDALPADVGAKLQSVLDRMKNARP